MVGKNNWQYYQEHSAKRIQRYAIRRLKMGVGSVIVATSLLWDGNVAQVNAQELNTDTTGTVGAESIAPEPEATFEPEGEHLEETLETEGVLAEETLETPQDTLEISEEIIPEARTAEQPAEKTVELNLRKRYETDKERISFENKTSFNLKAKYRTEDSKMFEVQLDEPDPEDEPEDIRRNRWRKLNNFIQRDPQALDFLQSDDSPQYELNSFEEHLNWSKPERTNCYNRRTY